MVLREPDLLFKPCFFEILPAIHERKPLSFGVAYPDILGRGGIVGVFKQIQEPGRKSVLIFKNPAIDYGRGVVGGRRIYENGGRGRK